MTSAASSKYLTGTSGWSYDEWTGPFYPSDIAKNKWFSFYAERFSCVEVNATFYRFFKDQTYKNWYQKAPKDFVYVLKAPRLITHQKHLLDAEDTIRRFEESAQLLKEKLGAILLQLAPDTPYEPERLQKSLSVFQHPEKIAVEIRNKKWLTKETGEILKSAGAAFCNADAPGHELTGKLTSDTGYIRLHGRTHWYNHHYSHEELDQIAGIARKMVKKGAKKVYIFFNNTANGYAPENALELRKMLE